MKKIKLLELRTELPSFDAFLSCVSFEARSIAIARSLQDCNFRSGIIFENEEIGADSTTKFNLDQLKGILGTRFTPANISVHDPLASYHRFGRVVEDLIRNGAKRIILDITTFTHEQLLMLLKVITSSGINLDGIHFLYTAASQYSTRETGTDKWLTRGVDYIRSVLGFPGLLYPSRDLHLIVLMGFEVERAGRLIRRFEPSVFSLGSADQSRSVSTELAELNQRFMNKLLQSFPSSSLFSFSAIDPYATADSIIEQVSKRGKGLNTVIAPLNTKLSTIGAGIAALSHPEFQLCYAPALLYNTVGYSEPADYCYHFQMK